MPAKRVKFSTATPADAVAIAELRTAAAADLTARHGEGWWSGACTEKGILFDLRYSTVFVGRDHDRVIATFRLATKKPWAIDLAYFSPVARPLYLVSMAVDPTLQRLGVGRACMDYAAAAARRWPAQSICLDAFDHDAGAGEFYRKCGYRESGRIVYRNVPLIYFELLL